MVNSASDSTPTLTSSVVEGGCPAYADTCTNLIDTDPRLGALGDYGGDTQTIPLLPGPSAIDAGSIPSRSSGGRESPISKRPDRSAPPRWESHCLGACQVLCAPHRTWDAGRRLLRACTKQDLPDAFRAQPDRMTRPSIAFRNEDTDSRSQAETKSEIGVIEPRALSFTIIRSRRCGYIIRGSNAKQRG